MRTIKDKINEEREKFSKLSDISKDEKIPYKKGVEIQKEKIEHYNKFMFLKKLYDAMEDKK